MVSGGGAAAVEEAITGAVTDLLTLTRNGNGAGLESGVSDERRRGTM